MWAFEGSWGADYKNDHDFSISVSATDKGNSPFKPLIKTFKIIDSNGSEILVEEYVSGGQPNQKEFYLGSKDNIFIPFKIKRIKIIVEIDFEKNEEIVTKVFEIPLKRKEKQMVFIKMV